MLQIIYYSYFIVKGDYVKKVILTFGGLGYNNINQAKVYIYDNNGCLLYKCHTYNGCVSVCLKENKIYRLVAENKYNKICRSFKVTKYNKYIFYFPGSIYNARRNNNITFLLNDYYYDNLKIEKGNLIING